MVLEQLEEAAAPAEPFFILTAKEVDGVHVSVQEPVHTRTVDLKQKILQSLPAGVPITGDRGYRLDDVKAGKVTLDAFVAQLDPTELEAISRGAYIMNSPLGAPGNAGVFGGVLVFGFIGLFLGPMLLALGQVLIREWLAITEYDEQPSI